MSLGCRGKAQPVFSKTEKTLTRDRHKPLWASGVMGTPGSRWDPCGHWTKNTEAIFEEKPCVINEQLTILAKVWTEGGGEGLDNRPSSASRLPFVDVGELQRSQKTSITIHSNQVICLWLHFCRILLHVFSRSSVVASS